MDTKTPQENSMQQKTRNTLSAAFMPVLSLISLYIILNSTITGHISIYSIILTLIFPAAYCCTLIVSRSMFTKVLPIFGSCIAVAIALLSRDVKIDNKMFISDTLISASCLIAISAFMFYCCVKKSSKTAMFTVICVILVITSLISLCAYVIFDNGYFSISLLVEQINSLFRQIRSEGMAIYNAALDDKNVLDTFNDILSGTLSQEELTKEELLSLLETGIEAILSVIRFCLPSILALSSMAPAFVIIALFGAFAKSCNIKLSNETEPWEYTVGGITARVYNTVLFIAILGGIIRLPGALIITCINLVIMLTPLLDIIAVKGIYRFLKKRNIHPIVCILIMLAVFSVISGMITLYSFILLAFIGVYITNLKEHIKMYENKKR